MAEGPSTPTIRSTAESIEVGEPMLNGMGVGRYDRRATRADDMLLAVGGDGQLPFDDVPHLLLGVVVLVDGDRVRVDLVYANVMWSEWEEASIPACEWLSEPRRRRP